jgi:hypothetical protein
MTSACCLSAVRLERLGQSILATVETQAARNSRGAAGGVAPPRTTAVFGPVAPVSDGVTACLGLVVLQLARRAPSDKTPASANARFFKLGTRKLFHNLSKGRA